MSITDRLRSLRRALSIGCALFAVSAAVAEPILAAEGGAPRTPDPRSTFSRPHAAPFPKDNAYTPSRELLGRTLFFDPRLSASGTTSCGTCHNPAFSWGDGLPLAVGHGMKTLARRSPTVLNTAWASALFWDGRADTLEEQALGPIASAGEMNMPLDTLEVRLQGNPGYARLFATAYPGEPIGRHTLAKAIATFERTVVSGRAPFDAWMQGDSNAIDDSAKRGFALFTGKARCSACHSGWRFTDDSFHDIGVPGTDRGRGKQLEGIDAVQFAFKTPTLRNVERRHPYMHDGSEPTLESVIDLYDHGGRAKRPSLAEDVRPLSLSPSERGDLVSFLKTLTSVDPMPVLPVLPQ